MNNDTEQPIPKTIGELRRRLAALGNPWEVDPQLSDDEPLPDPPRGGQSDEEIPEEARLVPLDPSADVRARIADQPPTNPFLRALWVEEGLLNQDDVEGFLPATGEEEWGVG